MVREAEARDKFERGSISRVVQRFGRTPPDRDGAEAARNAPARRAPPCSLIICFAMRTCLALAFVLTFASWHSVRADEPLWLAVGKEELLEKLKPLAEHRRQQGLAVQLVEPPLAAALKKHEPAFLLIVGDAPEIAPQNPELYRWRDVQPKTFASDVSWIEGAVGRVPATAPQQVEAFVRKVLAFENRELTPNDLRMAVWAGAPGYGGMIDTMATRILVTTVQSHTPKWSTPWFISADINQDLCGPPLQQPQLFCESMARGAFLGAFAAHANADAVFSMRVGKKGVWFHSRHARAFWRDATPKAPLIFLACNCGEFDRPQPSIAEHLLFLPGGPVATIGATTESHPLTNFFTGVCLMKTAAGKFGRYDRLGPFWNEAQRRSAAERNALMENVLRDVEGKLDDAIDVAKLRRDQQKMYALLGDPATRLPLPDALGVTVTIAADSGSRGGAWSVIRPAGATKLFVDWRSAVRPAAVAKGARARFVAANAEFDYTRLAELDAAAEWKGAVKSGGVLRLAAVGTGRIWVFVTEFK